MNSYMRCLVLVSLIGVVLALAAFQAHSATAGALTTTEAQADFDLMRKALEEAHSGLYRYSTKAEMDRMFDAQRAKLNRPVTGTDLYVVIAEMLAGIRCGHTGLTPDEDTQKEFANARMFPLRVAIEGRRLMVLFNDLPDDRTILPGMEILEINGHKPDDILNRILPKLSGDGDIETGRRRAFQRNFPLYFWLGVERASEFTIKARDAAGKTVLAKLAGITDAERKKTQNPVNAEIRAGLQKLEWWHENLELRFLKEPEVAVIHIGGFGGANYPKWMEDTFQTLREKGTKVLILDLRGNGGGNDMYGAMLVSYLTDKPFRYFDHIDVKTITPSFAQYSDWRADREPQLREAMMPNPAGGYLVPSKLHPGVAEQQPGKYPFMSKVFVLINGGTFSTAADFCAVAHHLKRATFIGEETGGAYYGNNSGMQTILTLTNSKFKIRVPMYEYWNAVAGYDGKRRGTCHANQIDTNDSTMLSGVDDQLEFAQKLASDNLNQKQK